MRGDVKMSPQALIEKEGRGYEIEEGVGLDLPELPFHVNRLTIQIFDALAPFLTILIACHLKETLFF